MNWFEGFEGDIYDLEFEVFTKGIFAMWGIDVGGAHSAETIHFIKPQNIVSIKLGGLINKLYFDTDIVRQRVLYLEDFGKTWGLKESDIKGIKGSIWEKLSLEF